MSSPNREMLSGFICVPFTDLPLSLVVKEPPTLTRLENNAKPEKPKPLRRKTVADSIIAPLLDSKSTQNSASKGTVWH